MPDQIGRQLELTFVVASDADLSPTDFIGLFECADTFVRYVVEQEALELFDALFTMTDRRVHDRATCAFTMREIRT